MALQGLLACLDRKEKREPKDLLDLLVREENLVLKDPQEYLVRPVHKVIRASLARQELLGKLAQLDLLDQRVQPDLEVNLDSRELKAKEVSLE